MCAGRPFLRRPNGTDSSKKGLAIKANPSIILVPEVGIEPTLPQGKGDFEYKAPLL